MKTRRISDNIEKILNAQIANEMNSSILYRAMGNCLEYNGWVGASKLWKKYSTEETGHAEKIINYMQDRNCMPIIPATTLPQQKFEGIEEIVAKSDEHEILVTSQWKKIASEAMKEADLMTFELAQWFVNEQIEEEAKMIYWLDRIEMYKKTNKSLGDLDEEMGDKV